MCQLVTNAAGLNMPQGLRGTAIGTDQTDSTITELKSQVSYLKCQV